VVRLLSEILQRFADQEMNGVAHVLKVLLRADVNHLEKNRQHTVAAKSIRTPAVSPSDSSVKDPF
jgi:hypothetical protein